MNANSCCTDDVIVVDASFEDYAMLFCDGQLQPLSLRHFSTGEAAVRGDDLSLAALWMVNMRLSDMEGVGLLGLVRKRNRRCPVFLVSDAYLPVDEAAARAAGASAYLCKPVDASWLHLCREAVSRVALRDGLPQTLG